MIKFWGIVVLVVSLLGLGNANASSWGTISQEASAWSRLNQQPSGATTPSSEISTSGQTCLDPGTGAPAYCPCSNQVQVCYEETEYTRVCKNVYEACSSLEWVCRVIDWVPGVGLACKAGDWICVGANTFVCNEEPKKVRRCYNKCP